MKKNCLNFWLSCLLPILVFSGCLRHQEAASAEIQAFHSGDIRLAADKDIPKTIYVDLRDADGALVSLPEEIKRTIAGKRFRLADSPSKAGYILHINIVRQGSVDPAQFAALVNAGYGSKAKFSGQGATGLLADALMVQRTVPSHKRPSRARLKNITSRNARDSSQMRLGLLAKDKPAEGMFARALARELQNAMSSQSKASAGGQERR